MTIPSPRRSVAAARRAIQPGVTDVRGQPADVSIHTGALSAAPGETALVL